VIRQAEVTDLPALRRLVIAFRDHLGATTPSSDDLRHFLPAALRDPSIEFSMAFSSDREPMGFAHCRFFTSIWAVGTECHLEDLYVLPEFRRESVGRQLIDFVIGRARSRGARSLGLHTNEKNTDAQRFYRQVGFAPRTEVRWDGGSEMYWGRKIVPR